MGDATTVHNFLALEQFRSGGGPDFFSENHRVIEQVCVGRRTLACIQKFNGLTVELRSESSSLSHVAPPRRPHRAPF